MPGEWFFLSFGGLGISMAGFAGLIFALDRRTDFNDPVVRWRIRNISSSGFSMAQAGLVTFPVFFLTDSIDTTVRITAAVALILQVLTGRGEFKAGPAWPNERHRRFTLAVLLLTGVLWLVDIVIASVPLLMLLFVIWLGAAIGTFMNVIAELRTDSETVDETT